VEAAECGCGDDWGRTRVNGDGLRRLALPEGYGYLASDVDELLLRVADEMDAGRPVGGLVANAALRMPEPVTFRQALRRRWPLTYEVMAVHWLLGLLRRCDDDRERARLEADPWRDLAAWDFFERHADAGRSGTSAVSSAARARPAPLTPGGRDVPTVAGPADGNADAWLACGGLPGTRMRWVRTGVLHSELRAEGRQVSASVRRRPPWTSWSRQAGVVRVGGRAFTSQRVSQSAWPRTAATFGAGFPAAGDPEGRGKYPRARVLVDRHGLPVLCSGGQNFDHRADAYIRLAGGRWFQFPVRGPNRRSAIMTALDQDGNKVALYRMVQADGGFPAPRQVEIAVHPDQGITDELLLVLAVSASWLWTYFLRDGGGG
jgi:hypothetical protein